MNSSFSTSNGPHLLVLRQSDGVSPNASQPTSGLSMNIIIGIAIGGGVLVLCLIVVAGWCCVRMRRERKTDLGRLGDTEFASSTSLRPQDTPQQRGAFGHGLPVMALTVDALRPSRPSSPLTRPNPYMLARPPPSPLAPRQHHTQYAPQDESRDSGIFIAADGRLSNERSNPETAVQVMAAPVLVPPPSERQSPPTWQSPAGPVTYPSRRASKRTQRPYSMDSESIYSSASAPLDALDRLIQASQPPPVLQPTQRCPTTADGSTDRSSTVTPSDQRQSTAQSESSSAFGPYIRQGEPSSFGAAVAQLYAMPLPSPADPSTQIPRTPARQPMLTRKPRAPGPAAAAPESGLTVLTEVDTPPATPGTPGQRTRPMLRVDTLSEPRQQVRRAADVQGQSSQQEPPRRPMPAVTPLLLQRKRRMEDEGQVPSSAPPAWTDGFLPIPPSPMSAPPVPPSPYSPMLPHLVNRDAPPPVLPRRSSRRTTAQRRTSRRTPSLPENGLVAGQPRTFAQPQWQPQAGSALGRS